MSEGPKRSSDGKPGWLAGWEQRQQAKFDRQQVESQARENARPARNVAASSPRGRHYIVMAVPMGESFFPRGGEISEFVRTFRAPEKKSRWAIGVVQDSQWVDRLIWREYLSAGDDEKARVAEVAEAVRRGTLPVQHRLRPWRRL